MIFSVIIDHMIQNAKKRLLNLKDDVLLALSGGPDSMCLFELLKDLNKKFHIAHIDHALQPSSFIVKEKLKKIAASLNIPFHSITLSIDPSTKNLEEVLREHRLKFFRSIMYEFNLKTLLVGHQKDERGETVIKRFFEGGSFLHLCTMLESSFYQEINVFRPLLHTTKKEIIHFLETRGVSYYTDPTNLLEVNLRGKMRVSLIPTLEKAFGKNIVSSVCDLADQIDDCAKYLEREVCKLSKIEIKGLFGSFFPYINGVDSYIYLHYVLKFLRQKKIVPSRDQKAFIKQAVDQKQADKKIEFLDQILYFETEGLFLLEKEKYLPIKGFFKGNLNWLEFWKGESSIENFDEEVNKKQVSEYHRINKTPVCLRAIYPFPLTSMVKKTTILN